MQSTPPDFWTWISDHGFSAVTFLTVLGWGWRLNANLSKFYFTMTEHPLHSHDEKSGNLTYNGLRYPRN